MRSVGIMGTTKRGSIERLYALDAGLAVASDKEVYAPGEKSGKPFTLSCNAYLVRRAGEWILWDTGTSDAVALTSGGEIIAHGLRGIVARTIEGQLAEIGLRPQSIGTVILSHGHFDHVGNAHLFANATWHLQLLEHAAMFGPDPGSHGYQPHLYESLQRARVVLHDGDVDLFGDGSVTIVSTPGHTPGHCSLLVRLRKTGPVLLSADVAHFRENMDARRVPPMNDDAGKSRASMEKVSAIVQEERAQLWLNHDIVQNATIPHSPSYFE